MNPDVVLALREGHREAENLKKLYRERRAEIQRAKEAKKYELKKSSKERRAEAEARAEAGEPDEETEGQMRSSLTKPKAPGEPPKDEKQLSFAQKFVAEFAEDSDEVDDTDFRLLHPFAFTSAMDRAPTLAELKGEVGVIMTARALLTFLLRK